jgi:tungstate transport system substrate-binding protein
MIYMERRIKQLVLLVVLAIIAVSALYAYTHPELLGRVPKQPAEVGRLKIATTSSLYDPGLIEMMAGKFQEKYNYTVHIPVHAGSGIAFQNGQRGDVDLLLVHDPAAEKKFLDSGDGLERRCFAYNYFYIIGPADDPAGIKGMNATQGFRAILEKGEKDSNAVKFISRGDSSGTHSKEKLLWKGAGYNYSDVNSSGPWYIEAGQPMGATLLMANEKQAYTLTDSSTFLAYKANLTIVPLITGGDELLNVYKAIAVSPKKHPGVNCEMANKFIDFLVSQEGQQIISTYGEDKYSQPLYFAASGNCDLIGCSKEECAVPALASCAA